MNGERRGRELLLGVGGVVVVLAALVGFFVGANTAGESVTVLGVLSVPATPASMAAYAAALATVVLGVLFGLVALASRYEDANAAGR